MLLYGEDKMNIENIEILANTIENQPDVIISDESGFCMRDYNHPCGTPACIEGWSKEIFGGGVYLALVVRKYINDQLISPDNYDASWMETNPNKRRFISAKRAAKVLRNLARTGHVDWSI